MNRVTFAFGRSVSSEKKAETVSALFSRGFTEVTITSWPFPEPTRVVNGAETHNPLIETFILKEKAT